MAEPLSVLPQLGHDDREQREATRVVTEQKICEIAFALSTLAPEERYEAIVWAFQQALAKRPDLTADDIDPRIVAFVAAIYRRIAEFEEGGGHA
jgi:hypothetical protein